MPNNFTLPLFAMTDHLQRLCKKKKRPPSDVVEEPSSTAVKADLLVCRQSEDGSSQVNAVEW